MDKKHTLRVGKYVGMACLLFVCATIQSCRDEYIYDDPDKVPEWLGESIYEELQDGLRDSESPDGWSFKYFLQVIDDCNYQDVLKTTGSKTLFVADDSAFLKGIKEAWGLDSYDQLNPGHKKTILYNAMLDNAYLLEMMSSTPASGSGDPNPGQCLRRETSANIMDTIYTYSGSDLPQNNPHWDVLRDKEVRMALDNTTSMMVHFLEEQLRTISMTDEDMDYLFNHPAIPPTTSSAYIFDKEVIKRDITCKNGYIHLLDGLLIPPSNMAEEIRKDSELSIYSRIIDRFAVPVYNEALTDAYNLRFHPDGNDEEIVYEKRYFTSSSNRASFGNGFLAYKDYEGNNYTVVSTEALDFSPGWNSYRSERFTADTDMAAMFAPTNDALMAYFQEGGEGAPLIERYGNGAPLPQAIDSIELSVISALLSNMMEPSFNQSIPSKFRSLKDDANDDKGVEKEHLQRCIIANNGVVYVTDRVYSPAQYVAVSAPSKFNTDMEGMGLIANMTDYDSYLLAMQSTFSYINPVNNALTYFDPTTAYTTTPTNNDKQTSYYYKLSYDTLKKSMVYQQGIYNTAKDSLGKPDPAVPIASDVNKKGELKDLPKNIYTEIMEHSIVVGDIADGNKYHQTKGYATIKVETEPSIDKEGMPYNAVTQIWGGRELEQMLKGNREGGIPVTHTYGQKNGRTYRLENGMIQPATRSVYNILHDTPEFKHFLTLCHPDSSTFSINDKQYNIINSLKSVKADGYTFTDKAASEIDVYNIFTIESGYPGLDWNVNSFSTYHYTVYVPDSNAIAQAIEEGLPRWSELVPLATAIENNRTTTIKAWNDSISQAKTKKDSIAEKRYVILRDSCATANNVLREELREYVSLIVNFVKYHMQDISIYVDNTPVWESGQYGTASVDNTFSFEKLDVHTGYNTLQVNDRNVVVNEEKENILYNVMARDIKKKNGIVSTSSYAVIHQIDGYLINKRLREQMTNYKEKNRK